jgi:hypothetical protein
LAFSAIVIGLLSRLAVITIYSPMNFRLNGKPEVGLQRPCSLETSNSPEIRFFHE